MQNFLRKYFQALCPLILGALSFFIVLGYAPLDPRNINWFKGWDVLENYIGWVFYRYDDWQFPIGLNPKNGLEISSSIVYSDSIPLAAILLKPFSILLGEPFQYFGIWYLLCFILQSLFSWLLIGVFTKDIWCRFFATVMFIFAPPFLWKLGLTEIVGTHPAPASHFLIIIALYLIFRQGNRAIWPWALLLSSTCLINFYIFVMVFALWVSSLFDSYIQEKSISIKEAFIEVCCIISVIILSAWQAGYFVKYVNTIGDDSYGFFRMTLLSIFDSRGWSYVLPALPQATQIDEVFHLPLEVGIVHGFQFLGLGGILLFIIALISIFITPASVEKLKRAFKCHLFFIASLFLLSVFALSNNISIAQYNIHVPIPDSIRYTAGILRSSGRMFWPVFYSLLLVILAIILVSLNKKKSRIILGALCLLQVIDSSAGWLPIRQRIHRDSMIHEESSFRHPLWNELSSQYSKFISHPLRNSMFQYNWEHIARFASSRGISTNAVYLARVDEKKIKASNQKFLDDLKARNFDPDAIYLLDDSLLVPVLMFMDLNKDLLARIPNFLTFIPNSTNCRACSKIPQDWRVYYSDSKIQAKDLIPFDSSNSYLIPMLAGAHGWDISGGKVYLPTNHEVKLILPLDGIKNNYVELYFNRSTEQENGPFSLSTSLDGLHWRHIRLDSIGDQLVLTQGIPETSQKNRFISISLKNLGVLNAGNLNLALVKLR